MAEENYAFPKYKDVSPSSYIDAYKLIDECSSAHTPRSFSVKLLDLIQKISRPRSDFESCSAHIKHQSIKKMKV